MTTQHGIRCPDCGEAIFSNSRHDFVRCSCDAVFVDGGFDYQRVGFTDKEPSQVTREVDRRVLPFYFRDEAGE